MNQLLIKGKVSQDIGFKNSYIAPFGTGLVFSFLVNKWKSFYYDWSSLFDQACQAIIDLSKHDWTVKFFDWHSAEK